MSSTPPEGLPFHGQIQTASNMMQLTCGNSQTKNQLDSLDV